ncbi:hypothetical protein, partial [Halorubrum ezzemoulense]|uniref:hypothetical protein n=1 Tax=Halorubrum ezzemoulense TaxID=337243 RepID=UPI001B8013E2
MTPEDTVWNSIRRISDHLESILDHSVVSRLIRVYSSGQILADIVLVIMVRTNGPSDGLQPRAKIVDNGFSVGFPAEVRGSGSNIVRE